MRGFLTIKNHLKSKIEFLRRNMLQIEEKMLTIFKEKMQLKFEKNT